MAQDKEDADEEEQEVGRARDEGRWRERRKALCKGRGVKVIAEREGVSARRESSLDRSGASGTSGWKAG